MPYVPGKQSRLNSNVPSGYKQNDGLTNDYGLYSEAWQPSGRREPISPANTENMRKGGVGTNIVKEKLRTLWYQDKDGNDIDAEFEPSSVPPEAEYYVTRFPLMLHIVHKKLIKQSEVDKCRHPRKYIKPTYGWIDGIVGRECKLCYGTQTKKKWHFWPKKWEGSGSKEICTFHTTWNNDKAILAMANSGDYTLSEAILVYTTACERCMNVLIHKYTNGEDGYAEFSEEWKKANTYCEFCKTA